MNQFTQYMMMHQDVFTQPMLNRIEFQDGLVVFINSYFKLRSEEKLKLARKIFYDFGKSVEKPLYPLERYDDTLEKISDSGIRFLGFIHEQIPVITKMFVQDQMHEHSNIGDYDSFYKTYTRDKTLSFFLSVHVDSEARNHAEKHADMYASAFETKKSELWDQFEVGLSELEQLGLVKQAVGGGIRWSAGGAQDYNLTEYGKMFISVIEPEAIKADELSPQ